MECTLVLRIRNSTDCFIAPDATDSPESLLFSDTPALSHISPDVDEVIEFVHMSYSPDVAPLEPQYNYVN